MSYSEAMAKPYQDKESKGGIKMNEEYKKNSFYVHTSTILYEGE